jgi:ethanolamine permease
VTLYYQFTGPVFRAGAVGRGYLLRGDDGVLFFVGRHELILLPEGEFALSRGPQIYKTI